MSTLPPPHERIAACSANGSPLVLRLRSGRSVRRGYLWVRMHENGDLERGEGDERSDILIKPLAMLGRADPRVVHAIEIRDQLLRKLWPRDLSRPPPWGKYYPVQAFLGTEKAIEGFIGIEVDMGIRMDIMGLDGNAASAAALLDGIEDLLGFLPG